MSFEYCHQEHYFCHIELYKQQIWPSWFLSLAQINHKSMSHLSQGIRSAGSIHAINLLTSLDHICLQSMPCGLIEMYWAKCKQSKFHNIMFPFPFVMTISGHWWSWSYDWNSSSFWGILNYLLWFYHKPHVRCLLAYVDTRCVFLSNLFVFSKILHAPPNHPLVK